MTSRVNDDWSLIRVISQASQSLDSALPRVCVGGRGGGRGHWDAGRTAVVQQTNTYVMSQVYLRRGKKQKRRKKMGGIKITFEERKIFHGRHSQSRGGEGGAEIKEVNGARGALVHPDS